MLKKIYYFNILKNFQKKFDFYFRMAQTEQTNVLDLLMPKVNKEQVKLYINWRLSISFPFFLIKQSN